MNDITQKMDFEFDRALTNFMHHLNVTMRVGRKLSDFILLVDNVEQWSTVSPLVMRNGPRLLITSEFRDLVPRDIPHQYLPIEPPSLDIARKIARFLRENESDKDIEDFVEAVGRKPRLIVDCLGMHNEREMPLRTMTLLIENEKSRVVQNRSKHERAVHILYEKYFNRLEARDHQAARCLLSVAFIGEGRTDATVGSLIIATYLATEYGIENPVHGSTWPNTGDVDPAIAVSLNVLMDRHLISRDNRSIYMHGITANLFRDIGETLAFTAYYAVILAYMTAWAAEMESIVARDPPQVDDDWELTLWQERNRDQLMSFTQPWAVCLRRALIGMPLEHYYHLPPQYRDTIVQHLSTYSYQAGTFADFEPLLRRALLGTSQVPMEADILNSLLESGYKAGDCKPRGICADETPAVPLAASREPSICTFSDGDRYGASSVRSQVNRSPHYEHRCSDGGARSCWRVGRHRRTLYLDTELIDSPKDKARDTKAWQIRFTVWTRTSKRCCRMRIAHAE